MKLLLDESLPRGLRRYLTGHDLTPVQAQGWAGVTNGKLLRLAEVAFEIFVTADQNIEYQQHLSGYNIAVIVLAARTPRNLLAMPPVRRPARATVAAAAGFADASHLQRRLMADAQNSTQDINPSA